MLYNFYKKHVEKINKRTSHKKDLVGLNSDDLYFKRKHVKLYDKECITK